MKVKIYMRNNARDVIETWKPKWLFLTLLDIQKGIHVNYGGYSRFIPLTAIQQIDFTKEK